MKQSRRADHPGGESGGGAAVAPPPSPTEGETVGRVTGTLGAALLALLGLAPGAGAHEERLVIGRIASIDLAQKVMVVQDPERDRAVRLTIDADTEVRRCRHGLSPAAVPVGARVRVKYLDRPGGDPETLSILLLHAASGQGR